jgi:acetyl esterase
MSLHPQSREVLRIISASDKSPGPRTIRSVRAENVKLQKTLSADPERVARVEHVVIPGPDSSIPGTLFVPSGSVSGLLVYLHGGGWSVGSVELSAPQARALANAGGCLVLSVEYRLAPEHQFPAGLEDAYAAVCWAEENARALGAPPDRIIVGGESSGANMAAAASLMARDLAGPRLVGQLLMMPALARHIETPSRSGLATGYLLGLDELEWFWDQYLGENHDPSNPYVSPLLAPDTSNLPPAIIATAEFDILRDEGEAYASRLRDAGVPTALRRFPGVLHGFLGQAGVVTSARAAFDWIGTNLRNCFEHEPTTGTEI